MTILDYSFIKNNFDFSKCLTIYIRTDTILKTM